MRAGYRIAVITARRTAEIQRKHHVGERLRVVGARTQAAAREVRPIRVGQRAGRRAVVNSGAPAVVEATNPDDHALLYVARESQHTRSVLAEILQRGSVGNEQVLIADTLHPRRVGESVVCDRASDLLRNSRAGDSIKVVPRHGKQVSIEQSLLGKVAANGAAGALAKADRSWPPNERGVLAQVGRVFFNVAILKAHLGLARERALIGVRPEWHSGHGSVPPAPSEVSLQ